MQKGACQEIIHVYVYVVKCFGHAGSRLTQTCDDSRVVNKSVSNVHNLTGCCLSFCKPLFLHQDFQFHGEDSTFG